MVEVVEGKESKVQWWVWLLRTSFSMSTDIQPQSPLLHMHLHTTVLLYYKLACVLTLAV